ncbi:hypothetical protein PGT21_002295 [Puccinia graminis f. sp. tritici]|uniref:Uncharacterized protein n=1 Tax=Puccinia graminis f. sp. tritici TaxID=56615 RepID=A0A5B0QVJ6_PUCGR|nr:hypothetical protein PGT21_002295 [Puccinia graminis f. sp. tritici]
MSSHEDEDYRSPIYSIYSDSEDPITPLNLPVRAPSEPVDLDGSELDPSSASDDEREEQRREMNEVVDQQTSGSLSTQGSLSPTGHQSSQSKVHNLIHPHPLYQPHLTPLIPYSVHRGNGIPTPSFHSLQLIRVSKATVHFQLAPFAITIDSR